MDYGYDNQYSSNAHGQGGGGGGDGGFMNEVGGSQGKKFVRDSLRPVTIKQLNEATLPYPDADFNIDGTDVTQVCFVGLIRNISQLTTFITYKLDDGTGEIEVKKWLDKDEHDPMDTTDEAMGRPDQHGLVTNGYAKAWGKMSVFNNNRRSITAHVIRPVKNMDEYHCHFLQATAVHLHFKRGAPPKKDGSEGTKALGAGTGDHSMGGARPLPTMSAAARKLYDTLNDSMQPIEGLHTQQLSVLMKMDSNDVLKACAELDEKGIIYTTVDDYTWAITPGS